MSHVYFLQGEESGKIKVGITDNLSQRLSQYRTHTSEPLKLLASFYIRGAGVAYAFEQRVLRKYREHITHGEWMSQNPGLLADIEGWRPLHEAQGRVVFKKIDVEQIEELVLDLDPEDQTILCLDGDPVARFSSKEVAADFAIHMREAVAAYVDAILDLRAKRIAREPSPAGDLPWEA